MYELIIPLFMLGLLLLIGGVIILVIKSNEGKKNKKAVAKKEKLSKEAVDLARKTKQQASTPKEDVFKFMEFDKILDDMIVQDKENRFTMAIKCKGINYDLMSEVEQLAVEEGFITFLNTIRFPIQLYVQAQNIDLKNSVKIYNDRLTTVREQFDHINTEYNHVLNSLDSTDEEIKNIERERTSIQNVLEYATDIVRYVERLSINKSLLQRNFYILVSYHSSEITSVNNFKKDEIIGICYNELYTRAQAVISGLGACSVTGKVLTSNELAELLYSSYNRDDKNYMSISQALESGFYRLYSTSQDAFEKRNEIIKETIEEEAKLRAIEAIRKAVEEGTYVTPEALEDEFDQEVSKNAIDIVKKQRIDEDLKDTAKKIIIKEYKEEKKQKLEQRKKNKEQLTQEQTEQTVENEPKKESGNNEEDETIV